MSNTTFRFTADDQPRITLPTCAAFGAAARIRVDVPMVAAHVSALAKGADRGVPSWSPPTC
ncbi:hypothetical protein [Nocardioides donggukensis]|uniref:Uncharacterized protein n=1 Tax=Nocardioides donggukensis TaxID=2774019 RepID=A0A927Q060_9ACTN|nr:hypothetical protein [Nocardioides donggukensis]MBD8870225.1 hypothetical protein [Nocardioides donggukensis]